MTTNRTWGGRFSTGPAEAMIRLSASVGVDKALASFDVEGSIAHARALEGAGVLRADERETIERGLRAVLAEVEAGTMRWDVAREDVHMNVEARLVELVGPVGGKLHTGRSRNDQVATDLRLWARRACLEIGLGLDALSRAIVGQAEAHVETLLPGYTHLQRAQPVRLAHHLLAWNEMLRRDRGRLDDAARRMNELPLGAGAIAGTTFAIDREAVARDLGFDRAMRNSMDATASRDFLVELVAALAMSAVHLSRIGEELVLWSSQEFGFVELDDAFATGSSMMPQKKNPDVAELVRGRAARVTGALVALLVLQKGLPLGYNRDLQEDKASAFDAVDTMAVSLDALAGAIATARFRPQAMRAALGAGFVTATELADHLVTVGVPFREAHEITGKIVRAAIERGTTLDALPLEVMRSFSEALDERVYSVLDPEVAVERRVVVGGPSAARVREALRVAKAELGEG